QSPHLPVRDHAPSLGRAKRVQDWRLGGAAPRNSSCRYPAILIVAEQDLEKGRIFLPGHLTKTGQERLVPLTLPLRQEFQRLRAQDGVLRIQGLVFHKNGGKLSHTYREVKRLCVEQKIEDFLFHDLRHCAVTNLADSGVDTETIMKIVGHSSVEMFLRYRTIKAENLDAAMTRMNTLITRHENAARQVPGIAAL
ncbi:MAG: site-specific integrase, partial [Nitrospirota bacterium]|nr:site-specific integrase [Nitrospirota bacterium]